MKSEQYILFRHQLDANLSLSELRTLAMLANVDKDQFPNSKDQLLDGLLDTMERRQALPALLALCRSEHPDLSWVASLGGEEPAPPRDGNLPFNPFAFGGRLNDSGRFFGRATLLRELKTELGKRVSVSLVGDSQVGKSSLLYHLYLTRKQWAAEMQIEYVDLQGVLDEEDFCETVLERLGQKGKTLRELKRGLANYHGILLLDEVERIAEADFNPRLHDLLRAQAQERHFALCLATRHALEDVFPTDRVISSFHNIFTVKLVLPFSRAESLDFLDWALREHPQRFTAAEKETLYDRTKGHPAQLQRLAHALFVQKFGGF
ncbi:MAG: hypothetical protein OT477_24210 [Chloroflexi bacterium]|nr:hypothetical protein [Chloroflexota bacterium]